ncbi:uncharacterized protein BKA55DRAFT_61590 [Fusarium redolens]|uniref:Uncharacterized protein n=1 Tax=Fusarium redolens TaxID=48865 RepID=A0A9P9RA09_FUSRE|nr:uncharacterized protein BKA55DRAFT_61590 [Fusarium redolens]KAH7270848.1 hypothetical protein BKA55DRAFT_61590 [Fusarium redolens]
MDGAVVKDEEMDAECPKPKLDKRLPCTAISISIYVDSNSICVRKGCPVIGESKRPAAQQHLFALDSHLPFFLPFTPTRFARWHSIFDQHSPFFPIRQQLSYQSHSTLTTLLSVFYGISVHSNCNVDHFSPLLDIFFIDEHNSTFGVESVASLRTAKTLDTVDQVRFTPPGVCHYSSLLELRPTRSLSSQDRDTRLGLNTEADVLTLVSMDGA